MVSAGAASGPPFDAPGRRCCILTASGKLARAPEGPRHGLLQSRADAPELAVGHDADIGRSTARRRCGAAGLDRRRRDGRKCLSRARRIAQIHFRRCPYPWRDDRDHVESAARRRSCKRHATGIARGRMPGRRSGRSGARPGCLGGPCCAAPAKAGRAVPAPSGAPRLDRRDGRRAWAAPSAHRGRPQSGACRRSAGDRHGHRGARFSRD